MTAKRQLFMLAAMGALSGIARAQSKDDELINRLKGDDPVAVAQAARAIGEAGIHAATQQLVEALERIPARILELEQKSPPHQRAVEREIRLASLVPAVLLDALVRLDGKLAPEPMRRWFERAVAFGSPTGIRYEHAYGPLVILLSRDAAAHRELEKSFITHWDGDVVAAAVAANLLRTTEPDWLVASLIDRPLFELHVRVTDPDGGTHLGAGIACSMWDWPKEFPDQVLYEFEFTAKPGYAPLLAEPTAIWWRRRISAETSNGSSSHGEEEHDPVGDPEWRDLALANLAALAGSTGSAAHPCCVKWLAVTWTNGDALTSAVAARRREMDEAWRALVAGLVERKLLARSGVADHPIRASFELTDNRKDKSAPLPDLDHH